MALIYLHNKGISFDKMSNAPKRSAVYTIRYWDTRVPPAPSLPGRAGMLGFSPQRPGTPGSWASCGFSLGMGYQTREMQPPAPPGPWCSHRAGLALLFLRTAQTRMNSRWRDFWLPTLVSPPSPKLKKKGISNDVTASLWWTGQRSK